jgi:hypothetical protein
MTKEEHELMIAMLAKQRRFIDLLVDLLVKEKIITKENRPAFEVSVHPSSVQMGQMYQETRASYLQAAEACGLKVDL